MYGGDETMAPGKKKPSRTFTVAEANAMLPLVRAIVSDLARLTREVIERHQRLEHVRAGRRITSGDPYGEELAQIEHELSKDRARLSEYAEELRQLGVEPKSAVDGIVDFPAVIDGALAFLCWKLGESEVLFWHPLHSGFAGRQPLTADAAIDGDAFERDA